MRNVKFMSAAVSCGAAEPRLQMTAGHSRRRYLYPPAQLLTNDENDDGCKDEDC